MSSGARVIVSSSSSRLRRPVKAALEMVSGDLVFLFFVLPYGGTDTSGCVKVAGNAIECPNVITKCWLQIRSESQVRKGEGPFLSLAPYTGEKEDVMEWHIR